MTLVAAVGELGLQLHRMRKSLRGEKRSGEEGRDGCACTHPPRVLLVLASMRLWDEPITTNNIGRLLDTGVEGADGSIGTRVEEEEAALAVAAAEGEEEEIGIVGC